MKHLMRFFRYAVFALALFLADACSPKEENLNPSVLSVTPVSLAKESGLAHTVVFKVTCDKAFKASLDASWASVLSQVAGDNDVTSVTVSLEANESDDKRSCTLTIESGNKKAEAGIVQLSARDLLNVPAVELLDLQPSKVTVKLPEDWTLRCLDEGGNAADWYSASIQSGTKNEIKSIEFRALSLNTGEAVRSGKVEFSIGGVRLYVPVSQDVTSILGTDIGIFNYDHAGADICYDPLAHQVSVFRGASSDSFRITDPEGGVFIMLDGLPKIYTVGETLHFELVQNWNPSLGFTKTVSAEVIRQDDGRVWLLDGDVSYVVKK